MLIGTSDQNLVRNLFKTSEGPGFRSAFLENTGRTLCVFINALANRVRLAEPDGIVRPRGLRVNSDSKIKRSLVFRRYCRVRRNLGDRDRPCKLFGVAGTISAAFFWKPGKNRVHQSPRAVDSLRTDSGFGNLSWDRRWRGEFRFKRRAAHSDRRKPHVKYDSMRLSRHPGRFRVGVGCEFVDLRR